MVTKTARSKARAATRRKNAVAVPDAANRVSATRYAGSMMQLQAQDNLRAKMAATDSLSNFISGMGTDKDKLTHSFFTFQMMDRGQLDIAYKGDWIARKAIDIPAQDATREWRQWQGNADQITSIEGAEKANRIQMKVKQAIQWARLYGGAGLVMGVDGAGANNTPLDFTKVKADALKFVHVVTRHDLSSLGQLIDDPQSEWYGEPEMYMRSMSSGGSVRIHPSRVIRFIGAEAPDWKNNGGWGDSFLQVIRDAIAAAGNVTGGIAQLVSEAKVDIVKIPGLAEQMKSDEYRKRLQSRFANANVMKSLFNTLLTDKDEEWTRLTANFAGLPDILQMYLMIVCAAVDVPATRFLSQSPSGMSATGESDLRNYYDGRASVQDTELTPTMERLDNVLIMSALGTTPEELFYEWRPLWQMTPAEQADVALKKSQVMTADVNAALLAPRVMQEARTNQLIEDGTYPGLEAIIEEFGDDIDERNEEALAAAQEAMAAAAGDPNDPEADPAAANQNTPPGMPANGNAKAGAVKKAAGVKDARASHSGQYAHGAQTLLSGDDRIQQAAVRHGVGSKQHKAAIRKHGRPLAQGMADRISGRTAMLDASSPPRSLYVRRDVLNVKDLAAWAKKAGFKSILSDLHVTIVYSKGAIDWLKAAEDGHAWGEDDKGHLTIKAGGPRVMQQFGDAGEAIVLSFANSDLSYRHRSVNRQEGATYDFDDYTPHITITYQGDPRGPGQDIFTLPAYQGDIVLGPEIWEEVQTGGFDITQAKEVKP